MSKIERRKTPGVSVGNVLMGGDYPVRVQAMTDTPTADAAATFRQTVELIEAGAELVRWTINDDGAAAGALAAIKQLRSQGLETPVIGDFHFNGHVLLAKHEELADELDKYRINPGNVGKGRHRDENFSRIIKIASARGKAVRIGVNWGSLDSELLSTAIEEGARGRPARDVRDVVRSVVTETALESASYAIDLGLPPQKLVLSAKMSSVMETVAVYQDIARKCPYVLHLGLTEAGSGLRGVTASTAALSILLSQGIGDTIRVSVTPEPGAPRSREVEICREVLQSLGLRRFVPAVVSCPGCGRTKSVYFQQLARDIWQHIALQMPSWRLRYPGVEHLDIAVMGCVVNGPGESKHAHIGISLPGAFEEPVAPVFIDGQKAATLKGERIKEEFIALLDEYVERKFGKK